MKWEGEKMTTVTGRVKEVKQPHGGYLPIQQMTVTKYDDGVMLHPYENTAPQLVGLAVDYLTRVMLGDNPAKAFDVSLYGLMIAEKLKMKLSMYPTHIPDDLSSESIRNAVIMASYDAIYRASPTAYRAPTLPNNQTIENIRQMVKRSVSFFSEEHQIVRSGFTFEGAYTDIIRAGDGDMLTEKGLWDMKVLRGQLTSQHSLQLLIYWRMGLRSIHPEFKRVDTLGFFNPRKNEATTIPVTEIPENVTRVVDTEVIGY